MEDLLLEQLYQILLNRNRPSKLAEPTPPPAPPGPIQPANIPLAKLGLETLGEFDFQRHAVQMFMRYIAQGYLVSESVEIRLAAVNCSVGEGKRGRKESARCSGIILPFIKVSSIAAPSGFCRLEPTIHS